MYGLKFRKTDILKIVQESLAKLPRRENIDLVLRSSVKNETAWIDHEQMVSTFFDLAQNAFEAMPDGGSLTITVTGDDRQVVVELTDTGVGIGPENVPLLFTPFFTTKPVGDGTGLGLPQAFASVKAHCGDISITSNSDPEKGPRGTTVKITLPRKQKFQTQEASIILHEE